MCCPLQILCITMMALALAEDSLGKRAHCDEIIDELGRMPEKMRTFMKVGWGWGGVGDAVSSKCVCCSAHKIANSAMH